MNINVVVIIGKGYTKEKAINEFKEEGYKHNFLFIQDVQSWESKKYQMNVCEEVWILGDCKGLKEYNYALDNGLEIWNMTV